MTTERKKHATDLTSIQKRNMIRLSMHFDKNVLRKKLKSTEIRRLILVINQLNAQILVL